MRHHSPDAACFGNEDNGVEYLTPIVLGRSATKRANSSAGMSGYKVLNLSPFGISQICGVSFSCFHTWSYSSLLRY